jgi:hypothetical protein
VAGLCTARWTACIDAEWLNAAIRDHDRPSEKLEHLRDAMRIAAPDWEVHPAAYEMLIRSRDLPDSEDEHVNAAALSGHADCIVTSNLKPFPDTILGPLGLEATHPDDFIVNQLDGLFPRHLLPLPVGHKTKSPAFAGLFGESVLLIRAYWSSLEYLLAGQNRWSH